MIGAPSVPGYKILHLVGNGGQAKVYLAERESDGLRVALKVLETTLKQDPVFLERFSREYRLIASIENEHVARIYDQGLTGEEAIMTAFEENARDLSRVGGN